MPTYRIDLAYDGSGFHGYARQPNVRTVQGELEDALFRVTGPVDTAVAGRTDRGVHALAQVVSFVHADELDCARLFRSLNGQLAPEVSVQSIRPVPDGFDARFSATSRSYTYLVLDRAAPDPFLARTSWHYPVGFDVGLMDETVQAIVGERDFAALCKRVEGRSTVRRVVSARWSARGSGLLAFDVTASSFCHQMVRSIVAVSVDIGRGKIGRDAMARIVATRDRTAGRGAAPPHGLTLVGVGYEESAGAFG